MITKDGFTAAEQSVPKQPTSAVPRGKIGCIGYLHSFKCEFFRAMAGVDGTPSRPVPGHRGGSVWVRQDCGMASGSADALGR